MNENLINEFNQEYDKIVNKENLKKYLNDYDLKYDYNGLVDDYSNHLKEELLGDLHQKYKDDIDEYFDSEEYQQKYYIDFDDIVVDALKEMYPKLNGRYNDYDNYVLDDYDYIKNIYNEMYDDLRYNRNDINLDKSNSWNGGDLTSLYITPKIDVDKLSDEKQNEYYDLIEDIGSFRIGDHDNGRRNYNDKIYSNSDYENYKDTIYKDLDDYLYNFKEFRGE